MLKSPKTDVQKLFELHGGADAVALMGKVLFSFWFILRFMF